jgi:hypothetical protein
MHTNVVLASYAERKPMSGCIKFRLPFLIVLEKKHVQFQVNTHLAVFYTNH